MRALLARYPRLVTSLPHVELGVHETPLETWRIGGATILAKRDDLNAPSPGGNKVRALELLLASVKPGQRLLTVGPTGSTHALAVAEHGARLGATTEVVTWPQEIHDVARATASRMSTVAAVAAARSVVEAYLRAAGRRLRGGVHWIPAGGSVPLGALGHVAAALELADQLARTRTLLPDTLVVPLGSGGTVAGLLVGLALAELPIRVLGVQVVPRLVANRRRVLRLAARTHTLLTRLAGLTLPPIDHARLEIDRGAYGGTYGRETTTARAAAEALRDGGGPPLDATYSAKAFGAALDRVRRAPHERVLFWLTFDGRWLTHADDVAVATHPQPLPSSR
jgi:D-cysteine desulfhydrase